MAPRCVKRPGTSPSFVSQGGGGDYAVADIVSERAAAWLPYASWSIVVAYEFDPDGGVDFAGLTPEAQQRFATAVDLLARRVRRHG